MIRCPFVLVLTLAGFSGVTEEMAAPPPTDAALITLVEALDHEAFEVREASSEALGKLGKESWPRLAPFLAEASLERRVRLRLLARKWGVVLEDQQAFAEECVGKLLHAEASQRAKGADGLLSLGPAGIAILQEKLASKGAKPVLKLAPDRSTIKVGEALRGKVTVTNSGSGVLWKETRSTIVSNTFDFAAPLGERRWVGHRRRRIMRSGCGFGGPYVNPIVNWQPIPQGKDMVVAADGSWNKPTQPGCYTWFAHSRFPPDRISPRLHPAYPETIDLKVGHELEDANREVKGEATFYALPDFEQDGSDERLALSIETANEPLTTGGCLIATGRVRAKQWVSLEKDFPRYAWYAWLDADGELVSHGSWQSVRAVEAPEQAERPAQPKYSIHLDAGKAVAWALEIPTPEKPGMYSLAAGYEIADGKAPAPNGHAEEAPPADPALPQNYDRGQLWTKTDGIEVRKNP